MRGTERGEDYNEDLWERLAQALEVWVCLFVCFPYVSVF